MWLVAEGNAIGAKDLISDEPEVPKLVQLARVAATFWSLEIQILLSPFAISFFLQMLPPRPPN